MHHGPISHTPNILPNDRTPEGRDWMLTAIQVAFYGPIALFIIVAILAVLGFFA